MSPEAGGPETGKFERLGRVWGSLALVFLNTCLLLVVLNLALWLAFWVLDGRRARPHREARSPETLSGHAEVHPGLEQDEIRALWEETYLASSGFVYEPFTQFRVKAFAGRYVTIDRHGFRRHPGAGPWPPDPEALNVFLYGGSTAFGYGVPDDLTVAAHLQRHLADRIGRSGFERPVRVYNFGRAGYFSTQERLLFERQLAFGTGPDVAVFLDGLNDCRIADKLPIFSARLGSRFEDGDGSISTLLARLPMMRLARAVAGAARRPPAAVEESSRGAGGSRRGPDGPRLPGQPAADRSGRVRPRRGGAVRLAAGLVLCLRPAPSPVRRRRGAAARARRLRANGCPRRRWAAREGIPLARRHASR